MNQQYRKLQRLDDGRHFFFGEFDCHGWCRGVSLIACSNRSYNSCHRFCWFLPAVSAAIAIPMARIMSSNSMSVNRASCIFFRSQFQSIFLHEVLGRQCFEVAFQGQALPLHSVIKDFVANQRLHSLSQLWLGGGMNIVESRSIQTTASVPHKIDSILIPH